MIIVSLNRRRLVGCEKKRYGEILKRLITEIRRFNETIRIFGDDVQAEIRIKFR